MHYMLFFQTGHHCLEGIPAALSLPRADLHMENIAAVSPCSGGGHRRYITLQPVSKSGISCQGAANLSRNTWDKAVAATNELMLAAEAF